MFTVNCILYLHSIFVCNGKGFLREYFYEPLEEMYDVQDIFGVFCVSIKYRGGGLGSAGLG